MNKKTRFREEEAGCYFLSLATPLSYPFENGLRLEALRPILSEGLPFSKSNLFYIYPFTQEKYG
jgi:hypothetical protein